MPFARHGPLVHSDLEETTIQRDFWNLCAIGFILDYRKFSVRHLQHIIDNAWRIRGKVSVVGRESYFYILSLRMTSYTFAMKGRGLSLELY